MQKHALKESGKQRECLIKGVAKKQYRPQRAKPTVPAGIWTWVWGVQFEIRFCTVFLYGNTAYTRKFGAYTPYNTYRFLKIRPPPLYSTAYNYTYTVLTNPKYNARMLCTICSTTHGCCARYAAQIGMVKGVYINSPYSRWPACTSQVSYFLATTPANMVLHKCTSELTRFSTGTPKHAPSCAVCRAKEELCRK